MSVSDVLWEIETAIQDVFDHSDREAFDHPDRDNDRQTAQSRRSVYEQALVDVERIAGTDAMHTLGSWIEREVRAGGRLPASHEVRQVGTEICRRTTVPGQTPPEL